MHLTTTPQSMLFYSVRFRTFFNMWINVEGLVFRINAAVSVKPLTDGQGSVLSINPLICKITYGQVLEMNVLKNGTYGIKQ